MTLRIASRKVLSTNGSTRATAYAASNKIISADGKTFAAWLDHVSEIRIATYHVARGHWDAPVPLGTGVDNHSGPGMTMDSEGFLHVLFGPHCGLPGPHAGKFQYRRSVRPGDASAWTPVETFGELDTYPAVYCGPDDTLHLTCRGEDNPRKALYRRRPEGGDWSAPQRLVDAGVPDGYTQFGSMFAVAPDGALHFAFHIYDMHPAAGKAVGYLRSRDEGKTWENAAGVTIGLPVTPTSDCFVEQAPDLDMRLGGLVLDGAGRPWLLLSHIERSPRTATLWCLDGETWRACDLLTPVREPFAEYDVLGGTLTFDGQDVMYLALTVIRTGVAGAKPGAVGIPANRWFGHPSCEVVLAVSTDFGETFEVIPISEVDSGTPNWLPNIERPYGPRPIGVPSLMYTHGGPGAGLTEGHPTDVVFVQLEKS